MNFLYFYLGKWNINKSNIGVLKKIKFQISIFNSNCKINNLYILTLNNEKQFIILRYLNNDFEKVKTFKKNNIFIIKRYLNQLGVNIFYSRMRLNIFFSVLLIKLLSTKRVITMLEIPTYPYYKEINNLLKRYTYSFLDKLTLKFNKNLIFLTIGKKLKNKECIDITNGTDIEKITIKKSKNKENNIVLTSVANIGKWHGYDRLIKGLYDYYNNNPGKEILYYCVGEGSELENLKKLTKELNLEKYVIFYGTKTGEELDEIVNKSDIAIGSLGMHRIDLENASTLKLREYCARGIPFIYAYNDFDFADFKYSMKIESNEKPVNINNVIIFYNSIKNENYIEEMRKYAEENLTWDVKMKPVIEKINELIKERNFDK